MALPLVVIPADDPLMIADSPQLERLAGLAEVRLHRVAVRDLEEQIERVRDADILINSRGHVKWPAAAFAPLSRLKMISTCSIGVDAIDLAAATNQQIVVSNVPGRTAQVVAEHALALMLGVARRVASCTAEMRAGGWLTPDNTVLRGKMLGVIGAGAIGREMIGLGKAIGMQVQAWTFNPTPERAAELGVAFVELDQLLSTSDVVSLHVKLTHASRGLIGDREIGLMKPQSFLVNTARGAVVDRDALVSALNSGSIAGAALDVFDIEPLPLDDPLRLCENVVLTPHSADQSPEGRELLSAGAVDNVIAFLNGKPQNVVN